MEKIAVILGCNLHWAPYYYRYETILKKHNIPFDVILWNREGIEEQVSANLIEFSLADVSCNNNPSKVWKFFRFADFVKKTVKKNHYSKLVFLGFQGCALTLNAHYFCRKYRNRFWIDIRDYHYEWFPPYYKLEEKVINAAFDVAISSEGFKDFLPPYDYLLIHNVDPNMAEIVEKFERVEDEKCIRISFIGNVRYFKENCALLNTLGNDERFRLQYFGSGTEQLEDYCSANNINNVEFHGRFAQSETINFYNKTDIINNVYGNQTKEVTTALSNKLYYALYLRMPILVSPGTFMEQFCETYDISYTFKEEVGFGDALYEWYRLNANKDEHSYFAAQQKIQNEEDETFRRLTDFILN